MNWRWCLVTIILSSGDPSVYTRVYSGPQEISGVGDGYWMHNPVQTYKGQLWDFDEEICQGY